MSDTVISYQNQDVHLVYKCSTCNNPVLISTKIYTVSQIAVSVFNKTTTEDAAKYVVDQFKEGFNTCYEKKVSLRHKSFSDSKIVTPEELEKIMKLVSIDPSGYLNCTVNFHARGNTWLVLAEKLVCPICGKHEFWQHSIIAAEDFQKYSADSFPKLYHSMELANLFVKLKLQEKAELVEKQRLIPGIVQKAQADYLDKQRAKQAVTQTLQYRANHKPFPALISELDALNDHLKQLKTFDFKGKIAINQQIAEKKNEIDQTRMKWHQEETDLMQTLQQLDLDLMELLYLAYGVTDNADIIFTNWAKAYRLVPGAPVTAPIV